MQLLVNKCDGSKEVYLHTKVMGTIAAALSDCDLYHEALTERLAEAVTTFLCRRYTYRTVSSDEIHAMIQAVLSEADCVNAALALHEHRITRQVERNRTEIAHYYGPVDYRSINFTEFITARCCTEPWNKTVIVNDLENQHGLSHKMARAIAGAVEEKVLRMKCRFLRSSLVRELVINELVVMRQAETALVAENERDICAQTLAVG